MNQPVALGLTIASVVLFGALAYFSPDNRGPIVIGGAIAAFMFGRNLFMQKRSRAVASGAGLRTVGSAEDVEALTRAGHAVLYKHSTTCPLSFHALKEVRRFVEAHPDIGVYLINVREQRALSDQAASALDVHHESPQIIVIRNGATAWHASHNEVTEANLVKHAAA